MELPVLLAEGLDPALSQTVSRVFGEILQSTLLVRKGAKRNMRTALISTDQGRIFPVSRRLYPGLLHEAPVLEMSDSSLLKQDNIRPAGLDALLEANAFRVTHRR